MLVRVEEAMCVAPEGHVIDLKAGEEVTGALAEYLVMSRCNVTEIEQGDAPKGDADREGEGAAEPKDESPDDAGDLSASLTATADAVHTVSAEPAPEPEQATADKPAKSGKAATK